MDMKIDVLHEIFFQTNRLCIRTYPGQCGLHGFLHDLANLTGHSKSTLTLHFVCFDEEHVTARRRPGQAYGHACAFSTLSQFRIDTDFNAAKELVNNFLGDDQLLGFAFCDTARLLAADCADELFEFADTCLARVMPHDVGDGFLWKLDAVRLDAILLDLPRNEVAERNVPLLLLGVAL